MGINGEAVCRIPDQSEVFTRAKGFEQSAWHAVIVVFPRELNVGVVSVDPEVDVMTESFVAPVGVTIVLPPFGRVGFEQNAVDRDAEGGEFDFPPTVGNLGI